VNPEPSTPSVPPPQPPQKPRWKRRRLKQVLLVATVLLLAAMVFGVPPDDEAAIRTFEVAAVRWQSNPDYRPVAVEYCMLADAALRTRPFLVSGPGLVLGARSLPFAPHRFALNASSRTHYRNFSSGPLVAYLFFCDEQSVEQFVGILESLGRNPQPTPADFTAFLETFHMEYPVCKDAGAQQSVAMLVRDTRSGEPFKIRTNVGAFLLPHVRNLALELGLPGDPAQMTPVQQLVVLQRLDDYVKHHDWELWRTKQLNDFCNGVWAQVYGQHYHLIIDPVLALRQVGTIGLLAMLAWFALRRQRMATPTVQT
jgi:hypothetical protein